MVGSGRFGRDHRRQRRRAVRKPAAVDVVGLTIARVSDLLFGPVVDPLHVRAAIDVVRPCRPDDAVVTGDFVSRLAAVEADLVVREPSRPRSATASG
ncbi:MAG TPA: hypothetical protein VG370_31360 [Chloroflexota bacterium]|nr:hypothetical protein [Chloroflexota bacterium]